MTVLVNNLELARRIRAEREATDAGRRDEVWEGVYVVSPNPNWQHQDLGSLFWLAFHSLLKETQSGVAVEGLNVSDRGEDWTHNFREPDVAVVLNTNRGQRHATHLQGGPDIVVEILSENDRAREKRPFYAAIGVREMLIVDRDPWALELYRLADGELKLVGRSTVEDSAVLDSAVLPIGFRLAAGDARPVIEVSRRDGRPGWLI